MSTLEELNKEIAGIRARIENYEEKYDQAAEERKDSFLDLIKINTQRLLEMERRQARQQEQQSGGGGGQAQAAKRQRILASTVLERQPALDEVGQFVSVGHRKAAGLSSEDSLLYVRAETVELWNALNDSHDKGSNLSVEGPPGTGKSTEVWAWVLWKAKKDAITVTWIHTTETCSVEVVINGAENSITKGTYVLSAESIGLSEGSLLVVDGVIATYHRTVSSACYSWANNETMRRFVLVSSASVVTAVQEDIEANIVRFTVASWILDQYREACANDNFFENVKAKLMCKDSVESKEELLLSKYYFAGGCARWMFEFSFSTLKKDIYRHVDKVPNYRLLFSSGSGENAQAAVNHLRGVTLVSIEGEMYRKKVYFFISQYTAVTLAEKCEERKAFLVSSYKQADETQNPAYKGWIFEFDFDYQLQCAFKTHRAFYDSLPAENKGVDSYVSFSSLMTLGDAIEALKVGEVLWAKPKLWCQKAYDFLCFWKANDADGEAINMVVVNATVAQTHSVLLSVVSGLASALGRDDIGTPISAIRFDFAIPSDAQFTGGTIEGRLCAWNSMNGTKWPNYACFDQYVDAQCIKVVQVAQTTETA